MTDAWRISKGELITFRGRFKSVQIMAWCCFCSGHSAALWAQNTNRNAWLWFFLGLFFSVVTVVVLLAKNSEDRKQKWHGGAGELGS